MKIRSLRLKQFKKFDRPVAVEGFSDSLNVIAGPNETGKSTLLLGLRAALFETHSSKADAVKMFLPHHVTGARPEVTLTFEIDGKSYFLQKRFLKGAAALLETPDGKRFEGSDAESELKRVLRLSPSEKTSTKQESPAHFGVLLTPQTRSFQQPNLADGTRHCLEAAIAADIAELGNQSEVDGLLAEVQADRARVVDGRGKPKGRYKEVEIRLAEIETEILDLEDKRAALGQDREALEKAHAERQALSLEDGAEELQERLANLEQLRTAAAKRQTLKNRHLESRQELQRLQARKDALAHQLAERERLHRDRLAADREDEQASDELALAKKDLAKAEEAFSDLRAKEQELAARQRDLEALGRHVERRRQIDTTLQALATEVRFELKPGALSRVTVDGKPLEHESQTVQVIEGLDIDIENVGRVSVAPKTEPLRDAFDARTEAEDAITRSLQKLGLDEIEPEHIEALWQSTSDDLETVKAGMAELEPVLSKARRSTAEAKATAASLKDRRQNLAQRLEALDSAHADKTFDPAKAMADLDADIAAAEKALAPLSEELQAASIASGSEVPPGLDQLDADISALRSKIEDRRKRMEDAGRKVIALESAINVRAGLGIDEQIDQLERKRHLLKKEQEAFALDDRTLTLLKTTLQEVADETKATFNAPLSARLAPYIADLFPGATPLVTPNFSIRAIDRNGMEEPFLHLSDGTREQIAILARLAYADMLRQQGLPALIILDDALAFSDEKRLERMIKILQTASERMQIIILTCREQHVAGLKATRLEILPVTDDESSAA